MKRRINKNNDLGMHSCQGEYAERKIDGLMK